MFFDALELSNNTSVRQFELFALNISTDKNIKRKLKGAYGEALSAYDILSSIRKHNQASTTEFQFQNRSINSDRSTPDFTVEFETYEINLNMGVVKWERDKEFVHTFFNFDGSSFEMEFESDMPIIKNWMIQYEVKTVSSNNTLENNYNFLKEGIEQINTRLSNEGFFTQDLIGVLVTDRDAFLNLYNDQGQWGEKFRTLMNEFNSDDRYLYLMDNLSSTSERGVYSAKDRVKDGIERTNFKKK